MFVSLEVALGQSLEKRRQFRKWTQTQLVNAIGSSQPRVAKVVGGRPLRVNRPADQGTAHESCAPTPRQLPPDEASGERRGFALGGVSEGGNHLNRWLLRDEIEL